MTPRLGARGLRARMVAVVAVVLLPAAAGLGVVALSLGRGDPQAPRRAGRALAGAALALATGAATSLVLAARLARSLAEVGEREARLERARVEAEAMARMQQELSGTLEAGPALDRIARYARTLCGADLAFIAPIDPDDGAVTVLGVDGARTRLLHGLRIHPGRGLGGRALETLRPCRAWNYLADPALRGEYPAAAAGEGIVSTLAVPMMLDQQPVGLLYVANRRVTAFGDEDLAVLQRLAVPAGLAIRNVRLVSQMASDRDLLEAQSRALARSAAELRGVVETVSDAILTVDPRGWITSINPAAEAMLGYDAEALLSLSLEALLARGTDREAPIWVALAAAGGRREVEVVRADGTRFPAEISASRVGSGEEAFYALVLRDITTRKEVERMKNEFIGTVSHELRTPLAAIRGHLELVTDGDAGPLTELQGRFLAVALQNTDRLGALVDDLLDVEKIEAGRIRVRADRVDLASVLHGVAETFRVTAGRKGLVFREAVPTLPPILGDRDRLTQVFSNLLSNAIKYTPGGEVSLSAAAVDGQVEVVVADTGIGLTEEERRHLFEKFYRSGHAVVQEAGGTGLGLAIAKGIVDRHGGRIEVESRRGKGSRFRVVFPAASPQDQPAERPEPSGSR